MEKVEMVVSGMSCEHCIRRVEKAILAVGKVKDLQIDLTTGKVTFYIEGEFPIEEAIKNIEAFGYKVER